MINEYLFFLEAFDFLTSNTGIETVRKVEKRYYATDKLKKLFKQQSIDSNIKIENNKYNSSDFIDFSIESFAESCKLSGLIFTKELIKRFIASLCTKPFVICSGLSGSGKTKLAQAFVQWISVSDKQYKIIPIGADWTNREPLLGYPNGLVPTSYVTPDNGALQLILEATKEENQSKPYFMILDEMNLSHVERYFADFLSIMESGEKIKLYSGEKRYSKVEKDKDPDEAFLIPTEIEWPKNLYIIGTVNIDETTYMFSPKVLDRANVIEFRIDEKEMDSFLTKDRGEIDLDKLNGKGKSMAASFLEIAMDKKIVKTNDNQVLLNFFKQLQKVGAEFGYRSANEIELLITKLGELDGSTLTADEKIDIAIMQKLLPKLHGSRKKLVGPLETLAGFCVKDVKEIKMEVFENYDTLTAEKIKYPLSLEKIVRMYKNAIDNGFTSYAEA